jgi:hypothetical protein
VFLLQTYENASEGSVAHAVYTNIMIGHEYKVESVDAAAERITSDPKVNILTLDMPEKNS